MLTVNWNHVKLPLPAAALSADLINFSHTERGKFYTILQRQLLTALLITEASSPAPTLERVRGLCRLSPEELRRWASTACSPEVQARTSTLFEINDETLRALQTGVLHALSECTEAPGIPA